MDGVGIALVFPKDDLVLPSLWEAVAGTPSLDWAVRDDDGKFISFTPEMERVWHWKDDLPARRLACGGKHLARVVSLIAPRIVSALYALTERSGRPDDYRSAELTTLQVEVAEAVLENGPCSGPEIRTRLGTTDKKRVDAAIESLQRLLVLTNAGVIAQEHGWPAVKVDLFARRWSAKLRRLPAREDARRELATSVLQAAGDVSAADLGAALRWRLRDAAATLEALSDEGVAEVHDEAGISIWTPRKRPRAP